MRSAEELKRHFAPNSDNAIQHMLLLATAELQDAQLWVDELTAEAKRRAEARRQA